jgi:5-hydroxyisourate hydrolase
MPGISVHVVDVTRGMPAQGLQVEIHRVGAAGRELIASGAIERDGAMRHAVNEGAGVTPGVHEVELGVGAFYRALGVDVGSPAFQERAIFRFSVTDVGEHYHLPVKLSPFGLSIWRGR